MSGRGNGEGVFEAAAPDWSFEDGEGAPRPQASLLSSAMVGSANRGRVLQALFDLGPTSRAELARRAGVNRTTISGIVQPLLDQQVLVEGEPIPSSEGGGKPARPLWFAPDARPICGMLLMPDSVRTCLVTLEGRISAEHVEAFGPSRGSDAIERAIAAATERTLAAAHREPLGIGVAVGGMVDTDRRSIIAVNLAPAMNGLQLGAALTRRFGLPAFLDHHPRALLVGDRWFGKGRGARHFAAVYTGEVLGGALYLGGRLYRGPSGAGGELGHTFVQVDGAVCSCGRRGCWETIATLGWLRREAQAAGIAEPERIDSARLVAFAEAGDAAAGELLDRYARNVAVGIANLEQTVAPNSYILHGDVVGGGERLKAAIAAHVRRLVPDRGTGELAFHLGETEDRAALLGAAGLVLSELLQFPL
ncbi:ROK family protein [Prosthecomicrobium pneumaticum]|uniref:Putative NBD/HSP70 family sugar kinase n=1 Tax=Prosthecomicrobium pneumaticum TaxID=81895 RepID=A0A7W9FQB0_9HYPH|nr:ROK family protein [Prosthecomicrobium pneumaticum]MBB5754845.1 putative NBD/HSP70 family sugar kinase [Prosthecomicrobium pneumaticum]